MLGETPGRRMGYPERPAGTPPPYVTVKAPVFSFEKLSRVDVFLGPEMKSTGEVLGIDLDYPEALYKAIVATGAVLPDDRDHPGHLGGQGQGRGAGDPGGASTGWDTGSWRRTEPPQLLDAAGLPVQDGVEDRRRPAHVIDVIKERPGRPPLEHADPGKDPQAQRLSDAAGRGGVPGAVLTALDTARALLEVLRDRHGGEELHARPLDQYLEQLGRKEGRPVPLKSI